MWTISFILPQRIFLFLENMVDFSVPRLLILLEGACIPDSLSYGERSEAIHRAQIPYMETVE